MTDLLPFQLDPTTLPEDLQHVRVIDFREAIPPGAMCERKRSDEDDGVERYFVNLDPGDRRMVVASIDVHEASARSIAMLHVWLSDEGDVAPGSGWTRKDRWREFLKHRVGHADTDYAWEAKEAAFVDSDLVAEAIRYLQAPYHISAGVSSDGEPFVVLAHPPNLYTHHGGDANRYCIGVGFAWGRGLSCDPSRAGDGLDTDVITDRELGMVIKAQGRCEARRDAVHAALWAAHEHYGIKTLVTHAQSSRDRVPTPATGAGGCPGRNIMWAAGRATALLSATPGVNLEFLEGRTWGSGRPLSSVWAKACADGWRAADDEPDARPERPQVTMNDALRTLTELASGASPGLARALGAFGEILLAQAGGEA